MTEEHMSAVFEISIAKIIQEIGFDFINTSALKTINELSTEFLYQFARSTNLCMNLNSETHGYQNKLTQSHLSSINFALNQFKIEINELVEYAELLISEPTKNFKHKNYEKVSFEQGYPIEIVMPLYPEDLNNQFISPRTEIPYVNTFRDFLQKDHFYRVLHGEIDDFLPKNCLTNFDAHTFEQKWNEVRTCDLISNYDDIESFSGSSCADLEVSVNRLSLNTSDKISQDYEHTQLNNFISLFYKPGYTLTSSDSHDLTSSDENNVQINSDSISGPEIDPDIDQKYRKFIPQLKKVHKSLETSENFPLLHGIKKRLLKDSFSSDTSTISKNSDEIDSLENIIWNQNNENNYDNPTPSMNFCEICRFSFSLKTHISQHENSKKHKNIRKQLINRKIIDPSPSETPIIQTITEINSYCEVCNFSTHFRGKFDKKLHEKTKWHKENAKFYVSGTYLCNPCKKRVRDVHKVSHETSLEHRRNKNHGMEAFISMHFCEMCQMSVPVEDRNWHESTIFHKENAGKFGKSLRSAGKVDPMDFVNFGHKRDRYESSTPIKCRNIGSGRNDKTLENSKRGESGKNGETSQNNENCIIELDESETTDNTPTKYRRHQINEKVVQIPTSLIDPTLPDRISQIKISPNSDRIKKGSPEQIMNSNIYAKLRRRTSSNSSDSVKSCKLYVMAVNNRLGNFSSNSEKLTPVKLGAGGTRV